ncbi:Lipase 1 [Psilocybe cubensis]|uniref:Carboxylic ester hydrolase n=2 Tax=Psilocybe cubensis TaxID=181762 RepID=A0A8H7XMW5_PSICU|nr:Lipase 1 [Psilocybe cubensis]KAH9477586.1 Lipase 1 [Psilocybe cubensis]
MSLSLLLGTALLFSRTICVASLSSNLGPVVDLGYAAFAGNSTSPEGIENSPVTFFGNIPYAEPPVGNLRFRAPKPLNENGRAQVVTDARNWGPPCIQWPAVVGVGSEDCLTLNVWKPTNATEGSKLPVVVYIHGGGFFQGSPSGFPFNDWVAQHPGGIVAASITYRLGVLGFMGGSQIAADGDLNAGLLDQRAGLEWIQRHISKFGGDPNEVTIMGESAGGASVVMQVVAYGGTKPAPFKRAAAHSIGFGGVRNQTEVERDFSMAASIIGCPDDKNTLSCMRNASVGAIVSAINRLPNDLSPVIDGDNGFLPDLPSHLINAGKFSTVEFLGGHCTGDGATFVGGTPDQFKTDDDIRNILFARYRGLTADTIAKAFALYPAPGTPGSTFATQFDRASAMAGDIVFSCMDWLLAEKELERGVKNVFAFSWNAPDTVLFNATPYRGAAHTSDLYYLFNGNNPFNNDGNTFTPFNTSEAVLASEAIAYWTSFVANGDPSVDKKATSPAWTKFSAGIGQDTRSRMQLTRGGNNVTASGMEGISPAQIERCQFWMSDTVAGQTRL